jgi:hypothetical protein
VGPRHSTTRVRMSVIFIGSSGAKPWRAVDRLKAEESGPCVVQYARQLPTALSGVRS